MSTNRATSTADVISYASNVAILISVTAGIVSTLWLTTRHDTWLFGFLMLFCWRYIRFAVNLVGAWMYVPAPAPKANALEQGVPVTVTAIDQGKYYSSRNVTVILPTIDPSGAYFSECLHTCCQNSPKKIIIVTAGDVLFRATCITVATFEHDYPHITFIVDRMDAPSKREQIARAIHKVETEITVFLDDFVFWGPKLLDTILLPFHDPNVGFVATNKRVRRKDNLSLWKRCWNMLGALYLERHNFEIRATNSIDGGVFVVSGRTSAIRTEILQHTDFLPNYLGEMFFFGKFGTLNADDDNYITRFVVRMGWDIKVQYNEDACVETTVGVDDPVVKKFLGQCTRWARTTWRSNSCALFTERTVWWRQPYCVYAVHLTSFTNFAAVVDPLLLWLVTKTVWYQQARYPPLILTGLACWMLFTKIVKVYPYYKRHPQDIVLFPVQLLFSYFHRSSRCMLY